MSRFFVIAGALSAFMAVGMGAFGAHGLSQKLTPASLQTFEVGARYQMYHAIALVALGFAIDRWPRGEFTVGGWCFLIGSVLFSGSLYALSLSDIRWLGAITPFGGLAFLLGWLSLAWGAWRT
jgi:uncharacterized membrane protein YgdD (TMEM256/DUF423 family)